MTIETSTAAAAAPSDEQTRGDAPFTEEGHPAAAATHSDPPPGRIVPPEHGFEFGQIGEDEKPIFDYFGTSMRTAGADPAAVTAAAAWFQAVQKGDLQMQKPSHPYNFRGCGLDSPEDQKYLTAFGNAMAAKGVSEQEVLRILRWYSDELLPATRKADAQERRTSAEESRMVERIDLEDRDRARQQLRSEWGVEYARNVQAINRYLDAMPQADREAIESEVDASGVRGLNNPQRLNDLLQKAKASTMQAATPSSVSDKIKSEIAEIENVMKTDRRRYNRDEAMQAHLRELYGMRSG